MQKLFKVTKDVRLTKKSVDVSLYTSRVEGA